MSEPISDCPNDNTDDTCPKEMAKERWNILAGAILNNAKSLTPPYYSPGTSMQRCVSFDIFTAEPISLKEPSQEQWFKYATVISGHPYSVNICSSNQYFTPSDLIKLDISGNICIWPSEEILAYYSLSNIEMFSGKYVLELGGGMTCLAGLMIAKYSKAVKTELTDGNVVAVRNVRNILCCNGLEKNIVKCSLLRWKDYKEYFLNQPFKYDIVILADCLYIEKERQNLIDVIWYALQKNGIALIMAPQRGTALKNFIAAAGMKGFSYTLTMNYNDNIWKKHICLKNNCKYHEDKDYPLLLTLTKLNSAILDADK